MRMHVIHVHQVLQKLLNNQLYVKAEKCDFQADKVSFLGFIISANQIQMDPAKVSAVANWATPYSRKKVQQFFLPTSTGRSSETSAQLRHLCIYSLHPRYCLSGILKPRKHSSASRFTIAPVLIGPDSQRQFVVEVDTSNEAIGAALSQRSTKTTRCTPLM